MREAGGKGEVGIRSVYVAPFSHVSRFTRGSLWFWRTVSASYCLRVAGWFGISLREHLRKPGADDTSYLGHEVGDLLPFLR
jgi:hypothetical protein